MAVPDQIDTVPDLYCPEVLPDFDSSGFDDLYTHPISTKDSTFTTGVGIPGDGRGNTCTECCSLFCSNQEDECTVSGSVEPSLGNTQGEHPNSLSYHDIWCDDNVSWEFDLSGENVDYDADDNDSSSLTTWPDLTVPELNEYSDSQNHSEDIGPGPDLLEDVAALHNVPEVPEEMDILPEDLDLHTDIDASPRSGPDPEMMADLIDTDWWDLSEMSPFSFSQTSQSSAVDEDDNAQTVPTLRTILQQHRQSADDTTNDTMNTDERDEERERRGQLLFNSSCAGMEQVVPTWPTEE